jgi:outer membrane protein
VKIERPATNWSFSQSFGSANLTIWDGGTKLQAVRTANARLDQQEINEVIQSFTLAQNVKTQYNQIQRQREVLETAQKQLENAQLQLKLAQARIRQGTALISDSLQSQLTIIQANNSILTAQNNIDNANAQLTRLTASEFTVTAAPNDTLDPPPFRYTEPELFAMMDQSPSVRSSAAGLTVAKSQEKAAKAIRWPQISATASFNRQNQEPTHGGFSGYDFGRGPMNYGWSFGLSASYTLFNGFAKENNLLNQRIAVDNADAAIREARLVFRQNLTQQLGQIRVSEAQLVLARLQVRIAEENLRVIQRRYEVGSATVFELGTAQQAVTTARNNLTSIRFDIRNARTAIETLVGRDLPQ